MKKRIFLRVIVIMILSLVIGLGADTVFAQSDRNQRPDQTGEANRNQTGEANRNQTGEANRNQIGEALPDESEIFEVTIYYIREWPVPEHTRISSPYGDRMHPIEKRTKMHIGIDIPAPRGTPVVAVESGKVTKSHLGKSYGNWIEIDHGDEITTRYAHNVENLVEVDEWVEKGDVIALVGNTGGSTGNHLHFEVRYNDNHKEPLPWLLETDTINYLLPFYHDIIGLLAE